MMGYWGYGYGPWGMHMFGGAVMMLLFWVLIISLVLMIVRRGAWGSEWTPHERRKDKTALDILKERYAKGEIGKQEFEEKKKDLAG